MLSRTCLLSNLRLLLNFLPPTKVSLNTVASGTNLRSGIYRAFCSSMTERPTPGPAVSIIHPSSDRWDDRENHKWLSNGFKVLWFLSPLKRPRRKWIKSTWWSIPKDNIHKIKIVVLRFRRDRVLDFLRLHLRSPVILRFTMIKKTKQTKTQL